MSWESAADFFAMGGYALYVWGSFGICALIMIVELILVAKRRNHILTRLRRERLAQNLENRS